MTMLCFGDDQLEHIYISDFSLNLNNQLYYIFHYISIEIHAIGILKSASDLKLQRDSNDTMYSISMSALILQTARYI